MEWIGFGGKQEKTKKGCVTAAFFVLDG